MPPPRRIRIVASAEDEGRRLDQVLAARVPDLSRRRARVLVEIGGVFVGGKRVKVAGRAVRRGQLLDVSLGGALERASGELGRAARARDEAALPAHRVVLEDDEVCVVDKPAGLLTAPTPESDRQNLADLLSRRPLSAPVRVVHRLDLPTSGLVIFAKTEAAGRALAERFRTHDVHRTYFAVVAGAFPGARTLDAEIDGRRAVTHLEVEERFGQLATVLRCTLETGRTHQIRLHASSAGHPILGDRQHGTRTAWDPPRLALHAAELGVDHPRTGRRIELTSPWPPADLAAWLDELRERSGPRS